MHTAWKLLIGALALAALSGTAAARDRITFSLMIGTPVPVYAPAPAYRYEAVPAYYPPPVSFFYAAPRVVYYAPPQYRPGPRWHARHYRNQERRHGSR